MAQPTNTHDRYDAVGVREDLIDLIVNTSPEDTPVTSGAGTKTATNTLHEWQRDSLRSPNKDNAAIDGDDATGSNKTPTERIGNYCQIFQDTIITSGRANTVRKAGRASEQKYFKAKAYKELQRDMEAMALSANAAVAGNSTTAMKAGGLGVQIYTNTSHGAGGSTTSHTSGAPTTAPVSGTGRAFAVGLLNTVLQNCFVNAGKVPGQVFMSPNHKTLFSAFTGIAVNRYNVDNKKQQGLILAGADVYGSDFGPVTAVPHWAMVGSTTVYGLDVSDLDVAYLRGFSSSELAKTGDSVKEQVIVDATICARAEKKHFKIADLTA